eukprot:46081_1
MLPMFDNSVYLLYKSSQNQVSVQFGRMCSSSLYVRYSKLIFEMWKISVVLITILYICCDSNDTVAIWLDPNIANLNKTRIKIIGLDLIENGGFNITYLNTNQLSNSNILNSDLFKWLLIFQANLLPLSTSSLLSKNYISFTKHGGNIILLGGVPQTIDVSYTTSNGFAINCMSTHEPYKMINITNNSITQQEISLLNIIKNPLNLTNISSNIPLCQYSSSCYSAIGWQVSNAMFIPLITAYDIYNRDIGWLISLTINANHNYYPNTVWIYSAISDTIIYDPNYTNFINDILIPTMKYNYNNFNINHSIKSTMKVTKNQTVRNSLQRIILSDDNKHFLYSNGSRFIMHGANYYRSMNGTFSVQQIHLDFSRAAGIGINCFRMFGYASAIIEQGETIINAIRTSAEEYNIYVILELDYDPKTNRTTLPEIYNFVIKISNVLYNETWLLGYDLGNEPYYWQLGQLYVNESCPNCQTLYDLYPYNSYNNETDKNFSDYINYLNILGGWSQVRFL